MVAEMSSLRGKPKSGCITVILRHGGKFVVKPSHMYFGGSSIVYENVSVKNVMSIEGLVKGAESVGLVGAVQFYVVLKDSFKLLATDADVITYATRCLMSKEKVIELCAELVTRNENESTGNVITPTGNANESTGNVNGSPVNVVGAAENVDESAGNYESLQPDDEKEGTPTGYSSLIDSDYSCNDDDSEADLECENNVDEAGDTEDGVCDDDTEEDVVCDDDDFDEKRDSDEESSPCQFPRFNSETIFNPEFELGMEFENKDLFKKAITSHAINTKRNLYLKKNDKIRVHARCRGDGCDWAINLLKKADEDTFQIRLYTSEHQCPPTFHVTNLSSKWLGQKHLSEFQFYPKRNIKGWRKEVMRKMNINVSHQQAYRARATALNIIKGVPDLQYTKLWDYAQEIRTSNPGSTCVLHIDNEGKFCKMYICFEAVKRGFKSGCRPFIGVDGCWLKGPRGGILLSAVGVDPSNAIFPIAYAVVSVENRETWDWFLCMLKVDLHIGNGQGYTFMSNKQKGLILAMRDVFPNAESRFCVRHLHNNMVTAGFRGLSYKDALWKAARASTVGVFNGRMMEMRDLNESDVEWFAEKDPSQWSKSHFTGNSKCDMLLNNVCESFNSCILDARDKPILTMFEWLRQWVMEMFQKNRDKARSWKGRLPPKITKILRKNMDRMNDCIPMKSNNRHYQIQCSDASLFAVDLELWSCSCRLWELSGIPCNHAMSAITHQHLDPELFVHQCYTVDTYKKVYEPAVVPLFGEVDWASTMYIPPMPPSFGRKSGRPTKTRRTGVGEEPKKRVKKMKRQSRCKKCGKVGHTMKKCKSVQPEVPVQQSETPVQPEIPMQQSQTPVQPERVNQVLVQQTPVQHERVNQVPVQTPIQQPEVAIFDDLFYLDPTTNALFQEDAHVVKKFQVKRRNLPSKTVTTRSTMPTKTKRIPGSKKGRCVREKIRGPPKTNSFSVTGSTANVTIRGLLDEDDTEFEALLSQAISGVPVAPFKVGPTPWDQLHISSTSAPKPTKFVSASNGATMFTTSTLQEAATKRIFVGGYGKGKQPAKSLN